MLLLSCIVRGVTSFVLYHFDELCKFMSSLSSLKYMLIISIVFLVYLLHLLHAQNNGFPVTSGVNVVIPQILQ